MTKPRPRRLLVPVRVGKVFEANEKEGVRGFLKRGSRLEKQLRGDPLSTPDVLHRREEAANRSPFFYKKETPRDRLIRERLVAARFPIVQPFTYLPDGGVLYHRDSYRTINSHVHKIRQKPLEWRKKLVIRMVELIRRMHDAGVSHNDLHETNILMNARGNIRFVDFEDAKMVSEVATPDRRSRIFKNDLQMLTPLLYYITRIPEETLRTTVREAYTKKRKD